ncbi:MAG: alpha/beta fold hydrolase [Myxococcota bacterium]
MISLPRWLRRAPRVGRRTHTICQDPCPVAFIVGLHGYGADERQIASLVPLSLDAPVRYLAPRAPHPIHGGGYGWFPIANPAEGPTADPAEVAKSCQALLDWIDAEAHGLPVVVVGYSQGGSMAMEMALRFGDRFAAIAVMAGALLTRPPPVSNHDLRPLFFGYGRRDPLIDPARRADDVAILRARGWIVEDHTYNIGHVVSAAERRDLMRWLNRSLVRNGHFNPTGEHHAHR